MAISRKILRVTGTAQTTDALTAATVVSYTLPTNTVVGVDAHIVGKDTANNSVYAVVVSAATRSGAGASQIGSPISLFTAIASAGLSGSVITIDVSGNDIRVRVNGVLATTIDWLAELTIWEN